MQITQNFVIVHNIYIVQIVDIDKLYLKTKQIPQVFF